MNEAIQRALGRPTSVQIVPYAPQYRDGVLAGAREMHANSMYHDLPLDEAKVIRQLAACETPLAPDRYFRLAVRGGRVIGGFYGHVRKTFFSDALLAHDMGWWVLKGRRGGVATILLLADFERWSREQGASKLMVGQSTGQNVDRTTRFFEHCGFRVIGFNTIKDL